MDWTVVEDGQKNGDWRVEAIDFENEGVVYVATFSGPDAKQRAEEYASIKNAQESQFARVA